MSNLNVYLVALFISLFTLMESGIAHDREYHLKGDFQRVLIEEALALDYPPEMALAVAKVSSNFKPGLIGFNDRFGIMQISTRIAKRYSLKISQLCEPRLNARTGIKYLQDLEAEFGSVDLALAYYHKESDKPFYIKEPIKDGSALRFANKVLSYSWRYKDYKLIHEVSADDYSAGKSGALDFVGSNNSCFSANKRLSIDRTGHSIREMVLDWESVYE